MDMYGNKLWTEYRLNRCVFSHQLGLGRHVNHGKPYWFLRSQFKGEGHDGYHWQMWGVRGCYALRCYIFNLYQVQYVCVCKWFCMCIVIFEWQGISLYRYTKHVMLLDSCIDYHWIYSHSNWGVKNFCKTTGFIHDFFAAVGPTWNW